MLLRVLGPASGVCLALGPVFPEVAHRGPSLNWSGGGISPLGELLTFVHLYTYVSPKGYTILATYQNHGNPWCLQCTQQTKDVATVVCVHTYRN